MDELKHRLFYTTCELQSTRTDLKEDMRKNNETIKQLLQLLNETCHERDEAKDQLLKTLDKLIVPSTTQTENFPILNPTITDFDQNLSQTYYKNYICGSNSSIGSILDPVSSSSTQPFHIQYFNGTNEMGFISSGNYTKIDDYDQASSSVTQNLAWRKPLPEKGRLLQAVMEAGPLLHTLLVAGNLPQWKNPPPLQTVQTPPISIEGHLNYLESINNQKILNGFKFQ